MAMVELPDDVTEAILLWVPAKSLIRFKCVSKSWCDLICNPYFREQHSALRPDATHFLISYSRGEYPKDEQTILTTTPNGGATSDPVPPNILEHGPFNLSSCHGLISMHPRDQARGNTFVYNPNTRETLSIPFNTNAFKDCTSVRSFIGFEPVSNQYKLMILVTRLISLSLSRRCEIITLGGATNWRQVETPPIGESACLANVTHNGWSAQQCLNGALHWLTFGSHRVVVFDLKSYKFRMIPGPKEMQDKKRYHFKLHQVGGCLTLVECAYYGAEESLELWTLKDYNNGVWVKESFTFSVPRDLLSTTYIGSYLLVAGCINNDEILTSLSSQALGYMETKQGGKIDAIVNNLEYVMPYTDSMRCY